ncbi:MAG: hypothetical protein IKU17_09435 [Clostridia bacterium]|nr:hypothetical protein [Clostridia bacterium]
MQNLIKDKRIRVIGVAVIAVLGALLLLWAYQQETYASIKNCGANPPFEGVYWGMTIPEFCKAMGIEEADLVPAEALTYEEREGIGQLERLEGDYGVSAEDLPMYEYYENHFDVQLTDEIFGIGDYYLGDKPLTIRVVFTDETTWNGRYVPSLLCFVYFQVPYNLQWEVSNGVSKYYYNEELPSDASGLGVQGALGGQNINWTAYKLSHMYSCGMDQENIDSYDVQHMSREELADINCPVYESVRSRNPYIKVSQKVDDLGWTMTFDTENVTVTMQAGYLAYYEWFLNELT